MNDLAPKFLTYWEFWDSLPHPLARQQVLRLSRLGRFPAYVRPAGLQSEPLFLESSLKEWCREKYFKVIPQWVEMIEKDGFVKPFQYGESVR